MTLDEAITKALRGREVKNFKHGGHEFHIKPVAVTRDGTKGTAKGQISHDIAFRADDQIHYSIVKERGVIKDLQMSIERGGLGRLIGAVAGHDIPDGISDGVGKLIDGTWEGACRSIIERVAVRL